MIKDFEICPKCGRPYVYAEHYNNTWIIRCSMCDYKTNEHSTHDKARAEWEKMKNEH